MLFPRHVGDEQSVQGAVHYTESDLDSQFVIHIGLQGGRRDRPGRVCREQQLGEDYRR